VELLHSICVGSAPGFPDFAKRSIRFAHQGLAILNACALRALQPHPIQIGGAFLIAHHNRMDIKKPLKIERLSEL
jgi:hypothetical protein